MNERKLSSVQLAAVQKHLRDSEKSAATIEKNARDVRAFLLFAAERSLDKAMMTFISTSTVAYYTTVGKATHVVTSGDIQFTIHEKTDQGTEFPTEGVYVVPGDIVSKQAASKATARTPSICG